MPDFAYAELLPRREDDTPFRLLTREGVRTVEALGRTFLEVEPEALRLLTETAMDDIAHFLRPAHLAQLRRIIDDTEASPNDRFVALDLLKNANISAGGVLPMCQDTGTAIVMGKRGSNVLSSPGSSSDEEAISRGVYLGSIGGPAARLAQDCIKHVEVLEYPELGMEAVWRIEVEDFPAFIVVDDKGNDFFADVNKPVAMSIGRRPGL
jgi:hypothetical protein